MPRQRRSISAGPWRFCWSIPNRGCPRFRRSCSRRFRRWPRGVPSLASLRRRSIPMHRPSSNLRLPQSLSQSRSKQNHNRRRFPLRSSPRLRQTCPSVCRALRQRRLRCLPPRRPPHRLLWQHRSAHRLRLSWLRLRLSLGLSLSRRLPLPFLPHRLPFRWMRKRVMRWAWPTKIWAS